MPQPDWDHKHPGDYPAYTEDQHGPNLHTHGADGKVDTVMGKSTNPMNSRCGLGGCDCEYTIGGLLRRLELIMESCRDGVYVTDKDAIFRAINLQAKLTIEQTRLRCDTSCLCYVAGSEAERRPLGS